MLFFARLSRVLANIFPACSDCFTNWHSISLLAQGCIGSDADIMPAGTDIRFCAAQRIAVTEDMAGKSHTDTLGGYVLTNEVFPDFYTRILTLRFPIEVAEVLELRGLINHSADIYEEPADIPQNREFRESLETAIQSFGIENRHHSERLLAVLGMLRGMHYRHTILSRDAELRLRRLQAENRTARAHSRRYGVIAFGTLIGTGLAWLALAEAGWLLKLLPLAAAIIAFGYFHTLPLLDREMERLTRELNDVLRKRVESLNWRTLIHKLALLLGYKQIEGIEVFRPQPDAGDHSRRLH